MGRWKALRPVIRPVPPARLLMTAVRTASARSPAPLDSPPLLISAERPDVAVEHLVAGEVDGVVGGQLARTLPGAVLPKFSAVKPPLLVGQLLLDDVGLDGDAEVVGLAGEVGGECGSRRRPS